MSEIVEQKNLPANIVGIINMREMALAKIAEMENEKKKYDQAIKLLKAKVEENDKLLIGIHKEHGDFEVGGLTVKTRTSWETVIVNEEKLPASCFKIKKEVSKTAVKELILEGKLPRDVAFQQKNESVSIK